jgi:hypothetical protein
MKNPSSPWARRPGSKAQSSISAFDTTVSAPQRPIARRRPNAPFCDPFFESAGFQDDAR